MLTFLRSIDDRRATQWLAPLNPGATAAGQRRGARILGWRLGLGVESIGWVDQAGSEG